MATMVDENNRNKEVGEMHNIEGWTKYVFHWTKSIDTTNVIWVCQGSLSLAEVTSTPAWSGILTISQG